ncbi:MAG: hypothetical protein JW915_17100 [Chitinispirillaceae bacterium]|nr:hypothetical protein [Chitinispirillaceae bacterium]
MIKTVNFPVQLLTLIAFLSITCSQDSGDLLAGGATGTEVSVVTGTVLNDDDSPASYASVRLRPVDYIADSSASCGYRSHHSIKDARTDSSGHYRIDSVVPGSYRIEAVSSNDTLGVIIEVDVVTEKSLVNVQQSRLLPMAEIRGEIKINYTSENKGKVQIYGIERNVMTDSNGMFRVRVPVGAHNLHIRTFADSHSGQAQNIESMDFRLRVDPGEVHDIGRVQIYSSQAKPCQDGRCDTTVLYEVLDSLNQARTMFDSVSVWHGGRIVALNFRNVKIQSVPRKIIRLSKVMSINFGNTGLTNLFREIGYMRNLNELYLDSNMLKELPYEIGELNNCKILDISGNIIKTLPRSITRLYTSELLNLAGNRLCTLDSSLATWAEEFDPDWKESQICDY